MRVNGQGASFGVNFVLTEGGNRAMEHIVVCHPLPWRVESGVIYDARGTAVFTGVGGSVVVPLLVELGARAVASFHGVELAPSRGSR